MLEVLTRNDFSLRPVKLSKVAIVRKLQDRVVVLKENCNIFTKCAILSQSREVDMESVVGDHELTVVSRSPMTAEGKLIDAKHKLVSELLNFCKINRNVGIVRADCLVIDAMCVVNQLTKPDWVKKVKELNLQFCKKSGDYRNRGINDKSSF